jgi:hypothetical protein
MWAFAGVAQDVRGFTSIEELCLVKLLSQMILDEVLRTKHHREEPKLGTRCHRWTKD